MVRIAHLSDPHIGPLPQPRIRELMSKRLTGYMNWRRGRSSVHDMALLDRILADLAAQDPDHIAFTGDVANIGLPSEFPLAKAFLERLGPPDRVSFVPGNHDAYVRGSLRPLDRALGAWMASDGGNASTFPFVRRRDGVALVGLSSAVPTLPFVASGALGAAQIGRMEELLAGLREEGLCRVIMIHHPPYRGGAKIGRQLTDAEAFEAAIARVGAEIVLHGHNHRTSLVRIKGPNGPVPVVGAPSASAVRGTFTHRAGYHLVDITPGGTGSHIAVRTRGLTTDGRIGDLGDLSLQD